MRNNAAYLPESPIVYIILPKSIRNRASFTIFALPREYRRQFGTAQSIKLCFLLVSALTILYLCTDIQK